MRSKRRQSKYSLVVLFVGIFAFWWGIAVFAGSAQITNAPTGIVQATVAKASEPIPVSVSGPVQIKIVKSGALYTYSGTLPLASSCDTLGTGLAVNGSSSANHVTLVLTLVKQTDGCTELFTAPEPAPFSASLTAKLDEKVVLDGLTVNGIIVSTTLETKTP